METIVKILFANSKTPDHRASHVYNFNGENYFYYPGVAARLVLQNTFFKGLAIYGSKLEVAPVPWRRWFARL